MALTSAPWTRCMINSAITAVLFWILILGFCAEAVAAQERAIRIGFPSVAFQELPLFAASKRGFFMRRDLMWSSFRSQERQLWQHCCQAT